MALFHRDKKVGKGLRKMDAVITGLVLGGIVASVYGIKKHEEGKKQEDEKISEGKMSTKSMLKGLVMGFKEEEIKPVEKKPGIVKIVLSGVWNLIKGLGKK
ncbi:MAG: hypothetical protein PHZ26_01890 [Candidatus Gracilibacteria bacterium]|nr:hypothetical protein [Candidatus Gracilibacteria bacterium]MDD2908486.1 hypothetical protein [Candidatus Gracilibacteria bacterium]